MHIFSTLTVGGGSMGINMNRGPSITCDGEIDAKECGSTYFDTSCKNEDEIAKSAEKKSGFKREFMSENKWLCPECYRKYRRNLSTVWLHLLEKYSAKLKPIVRDALLISAVSGRDRNRSLLLSGSSEIIPDIVDVIKTERFEEAAFLMGYIQAILLSFEIYTIQEIGNDNSLFRTYPP